MEKNDAAADEDDDDDDWINLDVDIKMRKAMDQTGKYSHTY